MRLDPNRALSPATIEAMRHLLPPSGRTEVADSALLQLALGIADGPVRLACARALLASPETRARLAEIRLRLVDQLGLPGDLAQLQRLSVFQDTFGVEEVQAIFPERFRGEADLALLAERSLIVPAETPNRYRVAQSIRGRLVPPESDVGWQERFVRFFTERAVAISALIAEGRWEDGSARLTRDLPDFRAAWRMARRLELGEFVLAFVDLLAGTLRECGAWDDFAEVAELGYWVSENMGLPKIASRMMSEQGVVAAIRGDTDGAKAFWLRRLAYNREIGNPIAEADTLLDLAGLCYNRGQYEEFRRWMAEAEPALQKAQQTDLTASYLTVQAKDKLRLGEQTLAVVLAQEALSTLSGSDGLNSGLFVQIVAAEVLAQSGEPVEGLLRLADCLAQVYESGRAYHATAILARMAGIFEELDRVDLAIRSLATAVETRRQLGTRDRESAELRLSLLLAQNGSSGALDEEKFQAKTWEEASRALVTEVQALYGSRFESKPIDR